MMKDFKFGLEAEYLLATKDELKPLWYKDLSFKLIDEALSQISLDGIPSLEGLDPEPPHQKLMPFVVEGYGIPDKDFKVIDAWPKGIEIRTPVCHSLEEVFTVFETLYARVKTSMNSLGFTPIALSHHPTESKFSGPQNKRRHDFWLWAMEVMTTYGPDINVSFPKEISDRLFANTEDLNLKVNYYAPAMAALSVASPFCNGKPWMIKNRPGKSFRTYRRSIIAPAIELHQNEDNRIEFKVFEMTNKSQNFYNNFLLVLALFLDENLKGRATNQERIYDSGNVARFGLEAEDVQERLHELLEAAPSILTSYGFKADSLKSVSAQLKSKLTPADHLLKLYAKNSSLTDVLRELSFHETLDGKRI